MRRLAVLFDLDNTLVDRAGKLADWAAEFTTRHGLGDEERTYVLGMLAERASPSTFDAIRTRLRLSAPTPELWRSYRSEIAARVSCPAEVLGGLDELRAAGWRVGVATNGAADIQWAKLRATGIAEHVDGVVVSEEVGARKPEMRHFEMALARCGAVPGEGGWMVGDDPGTDIVGGRSAGLHTIWVANGHGRAPQAPAPDHTVPHVRAAIDILLLRTADHVGIAS
ncbi:HAD family hydrolase [Streptomyces avicenniae]|uniref:HAD family hydrolase n=1 Tax=Streptomyces avicenniae TaxID=500153 RepID=UPI00069B03C0|nr:HAD family hydrolase [Streptomyces avicenniae]